MSPVTTPNARVSTMTVKRAANSVSARLGKSSVAGISLVNGMRVNAKGGSIYPSSPGPYRTPGARAAARAANRAA